MIKKHILLATLALSLAIVGGTDVANADAASGTASGNTKVEFTEPTDGALVLNKVPSFDFGSKPLASSYAGFSTSGSQAYDVTNLTGGSDGYTVTANAGQLTNGTGENAVTLPVTTLSTTTADGTADATTKGQITGASDVNIYQTQNKVATGNANSNGELTSGDTSATMNLTANGIKTGTYTGTVDYAITSGIS